MLAVRGLFLFVALVDLVKSQSIPVTGLKTGLQQETDTPPARHNINQLESEGGPIWDLFIRALSSLQDGSETEENSWFGVAGVHGQPYRSWNGVDSVPGGESSGFCPHGETIFTMWHRPYLALYEQLIGEKVQQLAKEYTGEDASAYEAAGQAFRLPYWDWASDARVPPSCTRQNITVNGPDGRITIRNPLYSYRWHEHPLDQNLFPNSANWEYETTRSPNDNSTFPVDEVNAKLTQQAQIITLRVYRAFSSSNTYEKMASMTGNGASFEAPHNDIHNLVGGSFATLTVTSFDALFMLHHCNLDRLAAMWSAIHYENTVQTVPYQSNGLFATAKGEDITADSPLKPFYQADGRAFHTTRSVLNTKDLGYTYPEFLKVDADAYRASRQMIEIVNDLYGSLLPPGVKRPHRRSATNRHAAKEETTKDWVVSLEVERSELALPCTINIYMRDRYAGRTTLLNMPMQGLVSDEIPLAQAIDASYFRGMAPEEIEDQLEAGLRFEIKKDDGTIVDPKVVPSLKLDVQGFDVTPPNSTYEFPSYNKGRHTYSKVFAQYNGTRTVVP